MKKRIFSVVCALLALIMVFQLAGGIEPMSVSAAKSSSELKKELNGLKDEKEEIEKKLEGQARPGGDQGCQGWQQQRHPPVDLPPAQQARRHQSAAHPGQTLQSGAAPEGHVSCGAACRQKKQRPPCRRGAQTSQTKGLGQIPQTGRAEQKACGKICRSLHNPHQPGIPRQLPEDPPPPADIGLN